MAELLINHVEESTTDEEIRSFLIKYGFPSFDRIERVPGTGERPAVLVVFHDCSAAALRTLLPRIHQVFWKNHTISALVMRDPIP
ncbi:RNA-binding protein [Achromobacter veterisilvae]|uniref:RNA-binding protein n=1 Tax=Achromobacter veterisilvae TaxID=2069367 RepID=A0A446CAL5_9BURK|nr:MULTISPECIES: RNA-binding protein [Achromobacter]MCW0211679.1 RNA-binding protein [Achromobacter sp.]SSW64874.1 hypothetical protein AVE30378_01309 [Achromobacter veterisilvae]